MGLRTLLHCMKNKSGKLYAHICIQITLYLFIFLTGSALPHVDALRLLYHSYPRYTTNIFHSRIRQKEFDSFRSLLLFSIVYLPQTS